MAAIDAMAPEPVDVLIGRAGAKVAWHALDLLGGTYGRRVAVLAGPGNNGADGRVAGQRLHQRGVRVIELEPWVGVVPPVDLLVDAAFGTSLNRPYHAPSVPDVPVLAVDVPSGVDALTGGCLGEPLSAVRTVTFAGLKPGLLLEPGRSLCGEVVVEDIGLPTDSLDAHLVEKDDVASWLPDRPPTAHKWQTAVWLIAGSAGMTGAAELAARGALRSGAGYVRLSTPGALAIGPTEAVSTQLASSGWSSELADADRFASAVIGPGLGAGHGTDVDGALASLSCPVVLDGDGLTTAGLDAIRDRQAATVVTPHEGEAARIGFPVEPDRLQTARAMAASLDCVALLKGPTTVVANPDGAVLVVDSGTSALATAGTGDVLGGVIGAFLARGIEPLRAAAAAAFVHGAAAAELGSGLVASDLPSRVRAVISRLA